MVNASYVCTLRSVTYHVPGVMITTRIKHPGHLIPWLLPLLPAITTYVIYGLSSVYSNVIMGFLPHEIIWVFYTSLVDTHVYRNMVLHAGDYTYLSTSLCWYIFGTLCMQALSRITCPFCKTLKRLPEELT